MDHAIGVWSFVFQEEDMQDNNNTDVQTFQYHHIVATDVRVNVKTGEVVEVGDPYLEDTLPPSEEEMIWSWEDDVWIEQSPADRFGPSCTPGVWAKTGWGRSSSMLESIFAKAAERVLPLCISCNLPIPEGETHAAGSGADPMCADCWHEACLIVGKSCEQCELCVVFVCDACECSSDGEKHTIGDAFICSDCLVSTD